MNRRVAGLLGLAVLVPGAMITWNDFRAGQSRFWLTGGLNMFKADRLQSPLFFWAFTAINTVLITALIAVCALIVVLP